MRVQLASLMPAASTSEERGLEMTEPTHSRESDGTEELVRDIHVCWDSLRKAIDRRLIVALDKEASQAERRHAAAWLAVVSRTAVTLDDDLSS